VQYWKHLEFFDKNGKNLNFEYDSTNDKWTGNLYLPQVSIGLFEVGQIYVLERFINSTTNTKEFGFPHDNDAAAAVSGSGGWEIEWLEENPTAFLLFQYNKNFVSGVQSSLEQEPDGPPIEIYDNIDVTLDYDTNQYYDTDGYLVTSKINSEAIEINFAIRSEEANTYKRTLIIRDKSTTNIVLEVEVIGETIEEDERLRIMTQNFGYQVLSQDSTIFRNTDVNEALPDFQEINIKRKEMMLEGHNIYTYIGSYKGLINAIKFFGYDNLSVKEFWRNVNKSSPRYGKYIHSNPIDVFSPTVNLNGDTITLPNKNYRKTSMFSLIYKINKIRPDLYDDEDLPLVEENSDYTIEEVLIKLFGLKKKLEKEFLPLNAHIKDIVGEADFFGLSEVTNTISRNDTNTLQVGIAADFKVTPNDCTYLKDLREFNSECRQDGAIIGDAIINYCNAFVNPVNEIGQNLVVGPYNQGDALPSPPIGPDPNSILGSIVGGQNITIGDISDSFLAYFSRYAPKLKTIQQLPDKPGIPIGAPVVLENTSFSNVTWDYVNSTWNQLDTGGVYFTMDFRPINPEPGTTFKIKDPVTDTELSYTCQTGDTETTVRDAIYNQMLSLKLAFTEPWWLYDISKEDPGTGPVIRVFGDTMNRLILTPSDPSNTSYFQKIQTAGSIIYTWDSIFRGNFIEIEWNIFKDEDEISPSYFYSVRGDIVDYERFPITLPYVGKYTVEMKIFDIFNNISSKYKTDIVCVDPLEVEYSGWYQARKLDYNWNSEGSYIWNDYGSLWNLPIEPSVTWDEETPRLYESLDRVNAILNNFGLGTSPNFQILNFQSNGETSFNGPYVWDNLDEGSWNDTYHLWWEMTTTTGDSPAFFYFKEVVPNSYLQIIDRNGEEGRHYFDFSTTTLSHAASQLNLSNDPIIKKYVYNVVLDAANNQRFIQAVCRYFGEHGDFTDVDIVDVNGDRICSGGTGVTGCESLIYKRGLHTASNPTWNTARFINEGKTLPPMTWIMFVYDKCKIKGKDKARWRIRNVQDPNVADIYFDSKYLTYLFKTPGKYSIQLELIDSNGNKYKKDRNILIIK
jgi:hypothetical protein